MSDNGAIISFVNHKLSGTNARSYDAWPAEFAREIKSIEYLKKAKKKPVLEKQARAFL